MNIQTRPENLTTGDELFDVIALQAQYFEQAEIEVVVVVLKHFPQKLLELFEGGGWVIFLNWLCGGDDLGFCFTGSLGFGCCVPAYSSIAATRAMTSAATSSGTVSMNFARRSAQSRMRA